ncbi:GNAT family N-acetyltransferase [Mucilaginibacter sp. KACC 22063]|uniref:GNAT family N-acetyltransferase n=1 Tax=Mucilaginibacter sp. KACC 22063 TaxID=3025666 RepID=UPI002366738C|nr:GNAT family N-acetyltransferase [Mucilaginibacter sp. KACC 22063]WDF55215.1 GNAT family N-acetyltransferase [Mucilaginibacter sp. KACC 22063]
MQTTIVTATEQYADVIKQLAEDTWWPTYSPILTEEQIRFMLDKIYDVEVLRQQIITGEQTFLILKEDDNPVGFAGYSAYGDNDYKLHKLYCLPQTQGKGYGKLLINTVADIAKKAGAQNLLLNVNRYNKAKSFYEKMGFSILREEDIAIGPFWMNDYIMQKPL